MTPERVTQIDEAAIAGKLPDRITVQAMCCHIRILQRELEELIHINAALREQVKAAKR